MLSDFGDSTSGLKTGDRDRFNRHFWEVDATGFEWEWYQVSSKQGSDYSGRDEVIFWEGGEGQLAALAEEVRHLNHVAQNWRRGQVAWGRSGVAVSAVGVLKCHLYTGEKFDSGVTVVFPSKTNNENVLPAIWAFCKADGYAKAIKSVDSKVSITTTTLLKASFPLAHWQQIASMKYPYGLPEPYSDDPTQWLFHGHPSCSTDALQVAVARLLGYRWPAELDAEMELATDAHAWIERSSRLNDFADNDGIVCIPAVGTEQPADGRLLNLLHRAYEEGRLQEQVFRDKLVAADENDPVTVDLWRRGWQPSLPDSFGAWRDSLMEAVGHTGRTLESWLRDEFFTHHCKLFHNRPFIWHIWDGLKDGFSVLVNYHKLDNKLLSNLIHNYLNDWIKKQTNSSEDGHEERLAAAKSLKIKLEKILEGEFPHDIFVRWKQLSEQPIGWGPDINDGVQLNIRPWMTIGDVGRKDAGILRDKPNCKWSKDRGKDVESAPWYHLGPVYGGKEGDRINDHHLTLREKQAARDSK